MNATIDPPLSIRLWGARGSIPVSRRDTRRYGGNTACIELRTGDRVLLVDSGSGAYPLGRCLQAEGHRRADLLLTHAHLDHIIGLPFFGPAYEEEFELRCWSAPLAAGKSFEEVLDALIAGGALLPIKFDMLKACRFHQFLPGGTLDLGDPLTVRTVSLNHPGGATGFRIECGGVAVAVITDHEHGIIEIDEAVAAFVHGADVMIYDASYTDEEYEKFRGWGHSTWQQAIALAQKAEVTVPVLFHHLPERTDDQIDEIVSEARRKFPRAVAARDGMVIKLAPGRTPWYET
jgi:phosphoribosyl 1,2-cyclic phosphodiesterase